MNALAAVKSLTLKRAREIAGSLGHPSKMPGTSYGISAFKCKVGSKLAKVPGSVCYGCYALKGNYQYQSVAVAHMRRLAGIASPLWALALATQIKLSGTKWHRWHDSGDIQSLEHLGKICRVAELTPKVKHWLPTREFKMLTDYIAAGGIIPRNLTIRVSATMVDGPATKQWPITSTVHTVTVPAGARECPAPKQGNNCGSCRACWNPNVKQVSYHKH
jgi:hypothetical protein